MKRIVPLLLLLLTSALHAEPTDSLFVEQVLKKYAEASVCDVAMTKDAGTLVAAIGKEFLGRPYVGGTLEVNAPDEALVVNTREVDCTTFVDQVLALTLTVLHGETDYAAFCRWLTELRYRCGALDGYASRLHYFTDFAQDNAEWFDFLPAADDARCPQQKVSLSFMSTHPDSYPALKGNPQVVSQISDIEKHYDGYSVRYIPKANTPLFAMIQEGDVVALLTTVKGLDVSHLGIVVKKQGELRLLHASSAVGKVIVEPRSLSAMLSSRKSCPGIRAIRLKKVQNYSSK